MVAFLKTWREEDSVEATVDDSAFWLALVIVSKWNSWTMLRIIEFNESEPNNLAFFSPSNLMYTSPEIQAAGVHFLVLQVRLQLPESMTNRRNQLNIENTKF